MHKLEDSFKPTAKMEAQRAEVNKELRKAINATLLNVFTLYTQDEKDAFEKVALKTYNDWREKGVNDLKELIWTGHEGETDVATFIGAIIMFLKFEYDETEEDYLVDYVDLAMLQYELFA